MTNNCIKKVSLILSLLLVISFVACTKSVKEQNLEKYKQRLSSYATLEDYFYNEQGKNFEINTRSYVTTLAEMENGLGFYKYAPYSEVNEGALYINVYLFNKDKLWSGDGRRQWDLTLDDIKEYLSQEFEENGTRRNYADERFYRIAAYGLVITKR